MELKQRFEKQTREYDLVFEPGELEDQSSAYGGVSFQPTDGKVVLFCRNDRPWELSVVELEGWRRKKDGSLGTARAATRAVSLGYVPESLRQTVADLLEQLNSAGV
jgi:hypothetical protein